VSIVAMAPLSPSGSSSGMRRYTNPPEAVAASYIEEF
jgi:hypothetical protein